MEASSITCSAESSSSSSSSGTDDPVSQQWPEDSEDLQRSLSSDESSVTSHLSSFSNQNFITKRITATNMRQIQAHDHVLAERKRREKLSESFIALSALIPGLTKMDKATVLEDATKYMKQLQDKLKILEEEDKKTTPTNESLVLVKKCGISEQDYVTEPLPAIKARFCNKDVLLIIDCVNINGVVEKLVSEIEKLHLSVVNTSVMSFGGCALSITVQAQKGDEFNMNVKELEDDLYVVVSEYSCGDD